MDAFNNPGFIIPAKAGMTNYPHDKLLEAPLYLF